MRFYFAITISIVQSAICNELQVVHVTIHSAAGAQHLPISWWLISLRTIERLLCNKEKPNCHTQKSRILLEVPCFLWRYCVLVHSHLSLTCRLISFEPIKELLLLWTKATHVIGVLFNGIEWFHCDAFSLTVDC